MECSNTTSQIYGKMEKWRNGMFRYYFPNLWRKSDFDPNVHFSVNFLPSLAGWGWLGWLGWGIPTSTHKVEKKGRGPC